MHEIYIGFERLAKSFIVTEYTIDVAVVFLLWGPRLYAIDPSCSHTAAVTCPFRGSQYPQQVAHDR